MGCVQSVRHLLCHGETSATSHLSGGMKGTSTTVPFVVVYVTVPNAEAGKKLAESIVKEKLAACVNRVPGIESVYWWNDKVHKQIVAAAQNLEKLFCTNTQRASASCTHFLCALCTIDTLDSIHKVQTDSEELLIIKTRGALLTALTEHVKSNHEYDVPEVIALPIKDGDFKYLEWIKNSTRE